jgi:hypothetical protein
MIPIESIENATLGGNADVIPCSARLVPTVRLVWIRVS